MFDRYITDRFLAHLEHITYGQISVTTPDGLVHAFQGTKPGVKAQFVLHSWSVVKALVRFGDIALAETYRDGLWDSPDLTQLFLFCLQNRSALEHYISGNVFCKVTSRLAYFFTRNTLKGSKRNILAHYDLGNDFYALWLDPSMTYSSALFKDQGESLQDAQIRKYDRIINRLHPSGRVLEIGCGWGGFAERILQKGDYFIKGVTLSKAQCAYATNRIGKEGVIAFEDYRHQEGLYDHIVSIEMFEAVGEKFWPIYFSKLKSLLKGTGKAMVQTITIANALFERYRTSGDAIRTFIFPGGMLPSHARFVEESTKAGLLVTDAFAFGPDYALTLEYWLNNFDSKVKEVKAMGFDQKFIRMWRFYLTCCAAAFRHGQTNVIQWELQHAV